MNIPLVFSSKVEASAPGEEGSAFIDNCERPPLLPPGTHGSDHALFLASLADTQDPLMYPSERFPVVPRHERFLAICQAAQEEGRTVCLRADISDLELVEPVKVTGTLRICGNLSALPVAPATSAPVPASASDSAAQSTSIESTSTRAAPFIAKYTIILSSAHSMFVCSGRGRLCLHGLRLQHTRDSQDTDTRTDTHTGKKELGYVGACILARNHSQLLVQNCQLLSAAGFCVWGIQHATLVLNECDISARQRSGCVLFGSTTLAASACRVTSCAVHGVCSRGTTALSLTDCVVTDCGRRGVYAYGDVRYVQLERCRFEGMTDHSCGAVEYRPSLRPLSLSAMPAHVPASDDNDHATAGAEGVAVAAAEQQLTGLRLLTCRLSNNAGFGLVVTGTAAVSPGIGAGTSPVLDVHIESCTFACNAAGDVTYRDASALTATSAHATAVHAERRDADLDLSLGHACEAVHGQGQGRWVWQFERDDRFHVVCTGDWREFDPVSQALLESAWQRVQEQEQGQGQEVVCVLRGGAYSVRLRQRTQINNHTHFERAVRRVLVQGQVRVRERARARVGAEVEVAASEVLADEEAAHGP